MLRKIAFDYLDLGGLESVVEVNSVVGREFQRHGMFAYAVQRHVGIHGEYAAYLFAGNGEYNSSAPLNEGDFVRRRAESYRTGHMRQRGYFGIRFGDQELSISSTFVVVAYQSDPYGVRSRVNGYV